VAQVLKGQLLRLGAGRDRGKTAAGSSRTASGSAAGAAQLGVRTPRDVAWAERAARIPRSLGVRVASGGPRPREAQPLATRCAWERRPVAQRSSARPAWATSRHGAMRRRPAEIVFLRPCLNTRSSKS
jgi:hypothetical protein